MTLRVAGGPVRGRHIRGVGDPVLRVGGLYLIDDRTRYVRPGLTFARAQQVYGMQADGSMLAYSGAQVPWEAKGIRLDPGWTQLLKDSHDISQLANWGPGTAVTVSKATGLIAPDGSTPCRMRPTSDVTTDHNVSQGAAVATVGQQYASVSVVKQDGYRYWRHRGLGLSGSGGVLFDLQAGAVLGLDAWSSAGVVPLRDEYKLCWSIGTAVTTVPPIWHIFDSVNYTPFAGNGIDGVIVAALNFTNTAYLAPMTVAGNAAVTVPNFSFAGLTSDMGVALGGEYTVGMEYEVIYRTPNQYPPVAQMRVGPTGGSNVSTGFFVHPNGSQFALVRNTADIYIQQSGGLGPTKSVLRVKDGSFRAASNGVLAAAGNSGVQPAGITAVQVGRDGGGGCGSMYIKKLWIVPALGASDAHLQALSSL